MATVSLKDEAKRLVDELSEDKLKVVLGFLNYLRQKEPCLKLSTNGGSTTKSALG